MAAEWSTIPDMPGPTEYGEATGERKKREDDAEDEEFMSWEGPGVHHPPRQLKPRAQSGGGEGGEAERERGGS